LYDVAADPHELQNLAESPEFSSVLSRMRGAMEEWLTEIGDQGCIPEIDLEVWRKSGGNWVPKGAKVVYARVPSESGGTPVFGKSINEWIDEFNGNDRLARLRAIKSLGLVGKEAIPTLLDALKDPDASVAFWAGVSLGNLGEDTPETRQALQWTLGRDEVSARLGAAGALCRLGHHQDALETVLAGMKDENEYARLYAAQILEMLAPGLEEVRQPLEAAREDKNQYVVRIAERALSLWE
jgi:HEAT repeat protein